jgi:exodeoxyribonuclease VII large subunit
VLARGFALVRDDAGHPLHSADSVGPNARLEIEFSDGRVTATTAPDRPAPTTKRAPSQPKPVGQDTKPAPKRTAKPVDQGSLF